MCALAKQTAVHKTKTLTVRAGMTKVSAPPEQRQLMAPRVPLELGPEGGNLRRTVSLVMLLVTTTDITVWVVSALLALGIGAGKYAKWKARNQFVRELAGMDRERREKVLSRMNPAQAMEARQELMRRFNIF
jgi:hypothetical protein